MTAGAGVPDTRTLITDEMLRDLFHALDEKTQTALLVAEWSDIRATLLAMAPQWRARWVAEALEKLAAEYDDSSGCEQPFPAGMLPMRHLFGRHARKLAAEYRDGTR